MSEEITTRLYDVQGAVEGSGIVKHTIRADSKEAASERFCRAYSKRSPTVVSTTEVRK